MSGDTKSGIARAIAFAGNQSALSKLIWEKCRVHIWQSRVSEWERVGWVSKGKAEYVSLATGIPLADLVRPTKRENRRVPARRKRGNDANA